MQSISYLDLEADFRVPFRRLHNPQRDMDVFSEIEQSSLNSYCALLERKLRLLHYLVIPKMIQKSIIDNSQKGFWNWRVSSIAYCFTWSRQRNGVIGSPMERKSKRTR